MPCSSSALVRAKTLRTSSSTISTVAPSSWRAAAVIIRSGVAGVRRIAGAVRATGGASGGGTGSGTAVPVKLSGRSTSGRYSVNVEPVPGVEETVIAPPSSQASDRLIDRPRPEPPYLRLVVPSACWNCSKMSASLSSAMPMPVSTTVNATTPAAPRRAGASKARSAGAGATRRVTEPVSVNLTALDSRLRSTCWSFCGSVTIVGGTPSAISTPNASPLSSACGANACST